MPSMRPLGCQTIETLESRTLLSASGLTAAEVAQLHAAGAKEAHKVVNAPITSAQSPFNELTSDLQQLYLKAAAGGTITATDLAGLESQDGLVGVSIHTRSALAPLVKGLNKLGFKLLSVSQSRNVAEGYLPASSLLKVASLSGVNSVTSLTKPIVSAATNQATSAMRGTLAQELYGLTGAGVKIGVISDSVSQVGGGIQDSIDAGNLPASGVEVIQDGAPGSTDEGRAMLEEIYAMAPGASLAFDTCGTSQLDMAGAVTALQRAGCNVIVDDIGFSDEPFFQDGVISQAINAFVAKGGSYVSAAGNDGTAGYLHENAQYIPSTTGMSVNWAPTGRSPTPYLGVTVTGDEPLLMEWDNLYNGVTGQATATLNLYVYDATGTNLLTYSNTNALATGIPMQAVELPAGRYDLVVSVAGLANKAATAPDMIKFVGWSDGAGSLSNWSDPGINSSTFGHASAPNTISVGAVPFSSAPPFSTVTPVKSETYSSEGPVVYEFNAYGQRLTQPLVLDKPDVSGVDGINTSFFGYRTATDPSSYPQFFGTSAAAPNVAAVIALIDQYHPGSDAAVVRQALLASAAPLNGAATGAYDTQGGYGLVDAVRALNYFGYSASTFSASFSAVSSPRETDVAQVAITFNEAPSNFTLSSLSLTLNGDPITLGLSQTPILTVDGPSKYVYMIENLSGLTQQTGTYVLTLKAAGIVDSSKNALPGNYTVTWFNDTPVTTSLVQGKHPGLGPLPTLSPAVSRAVSASVFSDSSSNAMDLATASTDSDLLLLGSSDK